MFLKLAGRRCLVVGAGGIAESKIESLLRADAEVTVVAPYGKPSVEQWAAQGALRWKRRSFETADVKGMFLVIAGTDQQSVNHTVAVQARKRGIMVNSVDDPPDCDFYYPSVVRRGDLEIAISTAGQSPALAQQLRKRIDGMLDADTGQWLDALGNLRREVMAELPLGEERKELLHKLIFREVCGEAFCPSRRMAQEEIARIKTQAKEAR
ncbi:precorrin-2 dehydrogenase/sirohydrochlorin ferrochelatase family protein [Acidipila rosea]|nr:bifunctional precorrin-2 dehydrogenase/sirohydrochlorin ferrochelatase [Acidipila rosea]